jgi:hypothetical protein
MNFIITSIFSTLLFNTFHVQSSNCLASLFQCNHFWCFFSLLDPLHSISFIFFNVGHSRLHFFGDNNLNIKAHLSLVWILLFCDFKEAFGVGLCSFNGLTPSLHLHHKII